MPQPNFVPEHVAQHPQERGVAVNIDRPIDAVDLDRGGHRYLHTICGSDAKTSFRWHSRGTAQLACGPSGSYAAPCERSLPGRLQCLAPPHQVVEHGLTALHEIGVIIQGATALDDPKIWLHRDVHFVPDWRHMQLDDRAAQCLNRASAADLPPPEGEIFSVPPDYVS